MSCAYSLAGDLHILIKLGYFYAVFDFGKEIIENSNIKPLDSLSF